MYKILLIFIAFSQFYCLESRFVRQFQARKLKYFTIKTSLVDHQPVLPLKIKVYGKKNAQFKVLRFVLDTGSNVSILNSEAITGIFPKKTLKVKSFLGEANKQYSLVRLNLYQNQQVIRTRVLFYSTKFHERLHFDGIIGNNILSKFKVFLELPDRVTLIDKQSKLDFISTNFAGSHIEYNSSHIILPAYIGDTPQFFIFDTGAGLSFLNQENFSQFKLEKIGEKSFYDLSGVYRVANSYRLNNFCLVKTELCQPDMEFVSGQSIRNFLRGQPVDGLLGINLIRKYSILIDYDNKIMYFQAK